MKKTIELHEKSWSSLHTYQQNVLAQAQNAAEKARAPYSLFKVGAAVLLENGAIIQGNNQENAAYPSGLCAERVALFATRSVEQELLIKSLAIFSPSFKEAMSYAFPCGACRQVMVEYEQAQRQPFEVLIANRENGVLLAKTAADLLPFVFNLDA